MIAIIVIVVHRRRSRARHLSNLELVFDDKEFEEGTPSHAHGPMANPVYAHARRCSTGLYVALGLDARPASTVTQDADADAHFQNLYSLAATPNGVDEHLYELAASANDLYNLGSFTESDFSSSMGPEGVYDNQVTAIDCHSGMHDEPLYDCHSGCTTNHCTTEQLAWMQRHRARDAAHIVRRGFRAGTDLK